MADPNQLRRRIQAIRRLARTTPPDSIADRLTQIERIATGNLDPSTVRVPSSSNFSERIAAGQLARSPRVASDKTQQALRRKAERDAEAAREAEQRRKAKGLRDRMAAVGFDREAT